MTGTEQHPFKVVIVGAGVAGLEAALALRDLAGDRLSLTLLDPAHEFVYRPQSVREPFAGPLAHRYALAEIAADIGAELRPEAFKWLDPENRTVHTEHDGELQYDALLLALGARFHAGYEHALTLDVRQLDKQLQGLVQDVEGGYAHSVAFIAPGRMSWPLPLYEIALMTARRAWEMDQQVTVTLITPEDAPLAVFGPEVSAAVSKLLDEAGIVTITETRCTTPAANEVVLLPGERKLTVDRVVAMPELFGPSTPGLPKDGEHGFITIDPHCRVPGVEAVFAAGDATDFYVKYGGLAAAQADVAAASIAALAGAPVELRTFNPEIHGILLGGPRPLYMSAYIAGEHGSASAVSDEPTWSPPEKIAARYLSPYLESRDRSGVN
ncbi:MAG: FAD-dependent oxidoreductase [Conexibacteraceae bacterium]|nr:FAD-dependent oxidoreductase [Conexibacteraceae bacterium]